jgi:surfeit locus 1 family protein
MTREPRSQAGLIAAGFLAAILVAALSSLGVWQVNRLQWKLDLIDRVETRLAADEVPAPAPPEWATLGPDDEYRRVTVTGNYDLAHEALVQAVTELGPGFWVMTPLTTPDDWTIWINRGFVPGDRRAPEDRRLPEGPQQVSGLLRMSQPDGAFLRANDPAGDRWYSRDTQAMAEARGLDRVAPYFIDLAADGGADLPRGGLTVVSFRNSHLSYALTWFAMAIGLAVVSIVLIRREWRRRHG